MEELDVSTVVRVPPEEAFEFLMDFPGYARYTDYLEEIRRNGDGGVGTTYDFVLSWWVVSYTASSRVTGLEPPTRIDWTFDDALDIEGAWHVEPVTVEAAPDLLSGLATRGDGGSDDDPAGDDGPDAESAGDGADAVPGASRIRLRARFDRDSVGDASLGLPRFVSGSRVLKKVAPVAKREARTILERIVADLEGSPREVDVEVHERPSFLA